MKKKSCGLFIFLVIFMLAGCQIQKDDYFTENGYFRVECINASQNSTTYNLQQNDSYYYIASNGLVYCYDYEEQKNELETCETELKRLTSLRKTIANPRWINMALSLKYQLKELKKPQVDTFQPNVEQDMLSKIESLKIQLKQMYLLPHDVKEILNEYINKYFLSKNGIVDSYLDSSMRYDDEERRVSLLKNGEEYSIRNVGSKSNYMFLHLCFFLGLHRSIMAHQSEQVGSFLFIDQPSIPYYADKNALENDDKKQLIKAFGLLNDFMKDIIDGEKNHFQIILIEHADESYWEDLEYFHTAANFSKTENGGLIPNDIYE